MKQEGESPPRAGYKLVSMWVEKAWCCTGPLQELWGVLFRTRDSRRGSFIRGSHPSFLKSCPVAGQPLARPGVWLSQNSWAGPYGCTVGRWQKVTHTESLKWDALCLYLGIAGCHSTGLSKKKVNLQGWQGRAKMCPRHFCGLVLGCFLLWMGRVPHDQISHPVLIATRKI